MEKKSLLCTVSWAVGMLAIGVLLAIFFVFRTLFTDGPASIWDGEYLVAHGLNFIGFFAAIAGVVLFVPIDHRMGLASIVVPSLVVLLVFMDASLALRAVTFGMVALGSVAGGFAGSWMAKRADANPA